jgi:DNA-binding FrmR family transcriptional regulator
VLDATRQKTKLLNRTRRMRGQFEALERALEKDAPSSEVLQLIAGIRGALNGLMGEVLEDHIRTQLVDPLHEPDADRARAAEELIEVVQSYLK